MALSDLTPEAVSAVLEEFDQLGRDAFLRRYGFKPARSYFLIRGGKSYDSKAVVGAAHGKLPGLTALRPADFSGGDAVVGRLLSRLGFEVVAPSETALDAAVGRVAGEHAEALRWFRDHAGETLPWREIYANADHGPRLVNQAKGIYKPQHTNYALSVRQTLGGPYTDREVLRSEDGAWSYEYFQENPDPSQRDREATNRGPMKCMEDGVPVGVLLQTRPKPGAAYKVLGLALVTQWNDGYFTLQGFISDGAAGAPRHEGAGDARRRISLTVERHPDFDAARSFEDLRERSMAAVYRRHGQAAFRNDLLQAYDGRCAITGCDASEALEAAHIVPYRGDATNHVQNGLLLRADIHSLFDLGLIAVEPERLLIKLAPPLRKSSYGHLLGAGLTEPVSEKARPSREALQQHLLWSGL